jgi:hypothetical protein
MIRAKFRFFQMQYKGVFRLTGKLVQITFNEVSERSNVADKGHVWHEFVATVIPKRSPSGRT